MVEQSSVSRTKENPLFLILCYEAIKADPNVLGTNRKSDELPILIKLIDAEDDLSVQVHPDNNLLDLEIIH